MLGGIDDVISVKIRNSRIASIKGDATDILIEALSNAARVIRRGYIEIRGGVGDTMLPLLRDMGSFFRPDVEDVYLLLENYDVEVGLYILYTCKRLLLMIDRRFQAYVRLPECLGRILGALGESKKTIRLSMLDLGALDIVADFIEKLVRGGMMELQLSADVADILIKVPLIMKRFRRILVYPVGGKSLISADPTLSLLEIFKPREVRLNENIVREVLNLSRLAGRVDVAVEEGVLDVMKRLSKCAIRVDYLRVSADRVTMGMGEVYSSTSGNKGDLCRYFMR